MQKILVFMLLLFISCGSSAEKNSFGNLLVREVLKVKSGGLFRANLANAPAIISEDIIIVIAGIGIPKIKNAACEKEKQLGQQARSYTREFLARAHRVELRNVRRGKKFRIVADVYGDSINLASELIRTRHAVKKAGISKTTDWCK